MTNRYEVCVGAEAFVTSLREALDGCTARLWVQFSTFEGDDSGQAFGELLLKRAEQGVDVRLLLDHYSDVIVSDILPIAIHRRREVAAERARTRELVERLMASGVRVQRTAPVGFLGRYLLFRDHKKMVLIDHNVAFVGGINISDHNFAWHDFMVKVQGPLAADLAQDFESTWEGSTVAFDEPRESGDFLLNQCPGRAPAFAEVVRMIDGALESVVVESPYLLGDTIEGALRRAAERGVRVTLVLPGRANHVWYRVWVRKLLRRLDHPNVAAYGYEGDHRMTHAKLVIVDDERATFGSLNFIEIESVAQKELSVFTSDPVCVAQLRRLVEGDVATSRILPIPRTAFGRFSYTWLHGFVVWWTRGLLRDAAWRSRYT